MNWTNVKLILVREIRDQLRDRRTLFMVGVLPLLLYPLLGISFFQVTHFLREHAIRVLVVGAPTDDGLPPLAVGDQFAPGLVGNAAAARLVRVTTQSFGEDIRSQALSVEQARRAMREGNYAVVIYFPPHFAQEFARFHRTLMDQPDDEPARLDAGMPSVEVFPNLANDASSAAYHRVLDVLDRWRAEIGRRNLQDRHLPSTVARPFDIATRDVAQVGQHKAALWSKILPFVLLIWALTGAFYPAVDLCAGEKERGTLETLLASPAERIEIVWGKLLAIMLFSIATALLNIVSLAVTGSLVLSQIPNLGPPPTLAIVWLLVALVPISALFSALCLALAAFARSTKEGQYYLMPLILITMPLVILPMAPGVELNLGNSLIPLSGVVLLLRVLLEGNYLAALPYVPVVVGVTLACAWWSIRWATNQFNSESVLFRESERWDPLLWLKSLLRDRESTPTFAAAMFCGVLILVIRFFMNFAIPAPHSFHEFAVSAVITQLVVIATPALLMTIMLTRSPAQTLLLRKPAWAATGAAFVLAVALHPVNNALQALVNRVYPLDEALAEQLNQMMGQPDSLVLLLMTLALIPAICEELAFRGFILSGLRRTRGRWTAIVVSSLFFGAAHALFQQSLLACLLGIVIGFVAVQSGSLLPCVAFHAMHNGLSLVMHRFLPALEGKHWIGWIVQDAPGNGPLYQWPVIICSLVASAGILAWFYRLPSGQSAEESLREAIDHPSAGWLPG